MDCIIYGAVQQRTTPKYSNVNFLSRKSIFSCYTVVLQTLSHSTQTVISERLCNHKCNTFAISDMLSFCVIILDYKRRVNRNTAVMLNQSVIHRLNFGWGILLLLKVHWFWIHMLPFVRMRLSISKHVKDKQDLSRWLKKKKVFWNI